LRLDGTGTDRSKADFIFAKCGAWQGRNEAAIAARLLEVSPKAQERHDGGDEGHALLTAQNAIAAVERDRQRRTFKIDAPQLLTRGLKLLVFNCGVPLHHQSAQPPFAHE
jgi:hypothetical protein